MTNSLADKSLPAGTSGICLVAFIPVRKAPQEQSEMISQLLFGEYYYLEEIKDKWLKVNTLFDHFTGWIDRKFFREANLENGMDNQKQPVLYSRIAEIEIHDGSSQLIPAGSSLPSYDQATHKFMIGKQKFRIKPLSGDILLPESQKVFETAGQYINTPYLWGGRSVFGFDCSGFIQTVLKIHGVSIQRDTSQQAFAGQGISQLKNAIPGDLAFFCNDERRINHVGFILPDSQIIHCSGWVRIDQLDEKGIFNRERGVYTHRLKEVRRVLGEGD
jgi:gamma-D-glutamyl-L-lysine dipeptidyl-peptidase